MHGTLNFKINTSKLKGLRKLKRLTQKELAKKSGISTTYYADIEKGRANGSIKALARVAQILDVTVDDLLEEDNYETR